MMTAARPASELVFVDSFVHSLGETKIHVRESAAAGRLRSAAEDLEAAGFRWHRVCEASTSAYDLAKAAIYQLGESGLLGTIDAIIYSTCFPQNANVGDLAAWARTRELPFLTDYPASRLQADFGLHDAIVVGLTQQGCTGMLGSIRLAAALLAAEQAWGRVLCVTADRLPEAAMYEHAYNLMSDGAAACIVGRERRGFRFLGAHQITNGGLGQASGDETVGTFFSYTHRLVTEALGRTGLSIIDLDWIVTQNTNHTAWRVLARVLGVDIDKVCYTSLADNAHALSIDTVVNLTELVATGTVRPGQRLALIMAGSAGLNYQCVILEATEEVRP